MSSGRLKVAWCLAIALGACGTEVKSSPAPLGQIRLPTGMVVDSGGRLLVANSNADLLYDQSTGGTIASLAVTLEPSVVVTVRDLNVQSFAGDLALARTEAWGDAVPDAEACGTLLSAPIAIFGTRGSNTVNFISVERATGTPSCAACGRPIGTGFADPLPVAIACGSGRARAFIGYLTAANAEAFIGQLDLDAPSIPITNVFVGFGPIRGFAYDRDRDRLYMVGLATGSPTPLRWVDLAGCSLTAPLGAGGCRQSAAFVPDLPPGIELRSMAFAPNTSVPRKPRSPDVPARAYITARVYDQGAAALAGFRNTDYGGLILVVDLVDNAAGGVDVQLVSAVPIGIGAQEIRVLPRAPGWAPTRRDVVAALTVDEGALYIYDDETGALQVFRQCSTGQTCSPVTGAPLLGHEPYGLAVDPAVTGATARLWVGSYADSFITPIDVKLDPEVVATFAGTIQHKLSGGAQ